ncbi:MAG: molybdopterin-dependent oxidoreductase [Rhodobacteraceae bacterium]|nr:molybdopterin-dependent oxidoreductase [Paracoccaceae bacterium]
MTTMEVDRRTFIVTSASAAGGLMLGFYMPTGADAGVMGAPWTATEDGQEVNAWLVIDPDNSVTIRVGQSEMGEGVFTGMPMLVAEELQCDWSKVRAVYADVNRHVQNFAEPYMVAAGAAKETDNLYQRMGTGGSGAVRRSRLYLMQAGASARERLKQAAADAWGVDRSCSVPATSPERSANLRRRPQAFSLKPNRQSRRLTSSHCSVRQLHVWTRL